MKLLCDACGKEEDIVLKDGLILFECRNVREETPEALDELFRKYGGQR
jgi:hypothetical protein